MQRLNETLVALRAVAPGIQATARQRFEEAIVKRQDELQILAQRVNAGQPLSDCWTDFREKRKLCVSLAREYLAFTQGALARHAGLDGGLLRVADALLSELSRRVKIGWDPLTVLAEAEWYGEEAQIIRLRFPEASIWNLPVAAHEFGHFAGPRLGIRREAGRFWELTYPLQAILRREFDRGPVHWSRMHELFADAFAVFLTGPAYACTSMLLRFDPSVRNSDWPTHPSHAKRAYLMVRTLERMDQAAVSTSYVGVLRQLKERWQASVAEASTTDAEQVADLEASVAIGLDATVDELWQLLQDTLPAQRYGGMKAAQGLKSALFRADSLAQPEASVTLADVLNAAWLCRIDHWDDDRDAALIIGTRALELCDMIVNREAVRQ